MVVERRKAPHVLVADGEVKDIEMLVHALREGAVRAGTDARSVRDDSEATLDDLAKSNLNRLTFANTLMRLLRWGIFPAKFAKGVY